MTELLQSDGGVIEATIALEKLVEPCSRPLRDQTVRACPDDAYHGPEMRDRLHGLLEPFSTDAEGAMRAASETKAMLCRHRLHLRREDGQCRAYVF